MRGGARQGHDRDRERGAEPEVTDLAAFLDRMGAQVVGAGSSTIEIEGVEQLIAADTEIMCDRVEAGTLLMACGMTGGEIELEGIKPEHLEIVVMKLCEMGMRVSPTSDGLWARGPKRMRAVDIATLPHPGFATDFMPLAVALITTAEGSGIVTENVYDGRFQFVDELTRMGADVRTEGRHADRPRRAPAFRRAGAGVRRAGRRRPGPRGPRRRRRNRRVRLRARRPRLLRPARTPPGARGRRRAHGIAPLRRWLGGSRRVCTTGGARPPPALLGVH